MSKIQKPNKIINKKTLLVTIDIGKTTNYAYMRCPNGDDVKPFKISNTRRGFNLLWKCVSEMKQRYQLTDVVVGVESTGPYGIPLMYFLDTKPVTQVLVNTKHTKKVKELLDNSPGKSDKKDPYVMADIIELNRWLHVVLPHGVVAELRHYSHSLDRHKTTRTGFYNQLQGLIFQIFPEFHQVFNDVTTKTAQYLIRHYPTPQSIVNLGLDELTALIKQKSHGKMKADRAKQLYDAAQHSVGIRDGLVSITQEIGHLVAMIDQLNGYIQEFEAIISDLLTQVPISRYLLSVKGYGKVTVACIIGEIVDFSQFEVKEELVKYSGLNLFEISSGAHQGQKHISKRGRPLLRKILFFAAMNVVRKGGIYHDKYQAYLDRGMPKLKALTAISRKLLRLTYALVRDQREFELHYSADDKFRQAA